MNQLLFVTMNSEYVIAIVCLDDFCKSDVLVFMYVFKFAIL